MQRLIYLVVFLSGIVLSQAVMEGGAHADMMIQPQLPVHDAGFDRPIDRNEAVSGSTGGTVLVTGATGRTGSLVYNLLKIAGHHVRGLVRNTTKAREYLNCHACDPSEGIFVGDVTRASTLKEPMEGVAALVILSASVPLKATNGSFYFPPGGFPKDVDYLGTVNQVEAAMEAGVGHIVFVSSMGTTEPGSFLDLLGGGHALMFKLNAEAALMSSPVPSTIVKPAGLTMAPPANSQLLVAHRDSLLTSNYTSIGRPDVAAVVVNALSMPLVSGGLRFDLTSNPDAPPSKDFKALFENARMGI